jgi:DNA primase
VEKRRFPLELADEFKIGAAAPDDTGLGARLLKKKFSEDALRQSGLFFVRDTAVLTLTSLRPRFRGRLMIPIRDHQGRVVAFTARQTDLTPADDPAREAKYINSPETPIFTKGNLLFNLDRARSHAGENKPFVLVEGQLDAMRCWHVGLKTAVAPQGTAITDSQLALLRRYTPQVECFFDGDSAGQKAALRFLPMALRAGLEIKFLGLAGAEKTDPDVLFLERGLAAYDELRRDSLNAMAFACRALLPSPAAASSEEKARATQTIFELVAAAESEVARAGFLSEITEYLHLPLSALQKDFDTFRRRGARLAVPAAPPETNPPPADSTLNSITPEHELISFCLNFDELFQTNRHRIHYEWLDKNSLASSTLSKILATSNEGEWLGVQSINEVFESDNERRLVASLMFDAPMQDNPKAILEEIIRKLESRYLASRLKAIEAIIAEKGPSQDEELFRLMVEHGKLCQQMSKIRSQALNQSRA